ncbi:MAG: hypothetical protein HYR73_01260 [Candidatus Eisenbacteria bacterium]|nr:hypothetical protein [Candidatus Eisenbacteria bacterium]
MFKRMLAVMVLVAATLFAAHAFAADSKEAAAAKPRAQAWTGEIVDMSCYVDHEAKGEKHGKTCGTKCVAGGTPMGLLTEDGKVYVLTLDHDNHDPYNECKKWVGSTVEVSGTMAARGGVTTIDVTGMKPPAAKPATTAK